MARETRSNVPLYVDHNNELWNFDPKDVGEIDQLAREGFAPAGPTDIDRHNTALQVQQNEDNSSFGEAVGLGAERAVSRGLSVAGNAIRPALEFMYPGAKGMPEITPELLDPRRENESAQNPIGTGAGFGQHAEGVAQARPFATGLGTALAAAPFAGAAGALAAPELGAGAGLLARGAAQGVSALADAAVEAVPQEYEDAWLEQRPATLKGVALNTLMFAGGDVALRGVLHGASAGLGKLFGTGEGNVLAAASGRAARADRSIEKNGLREARNVGAAAATKDEATQAIETLSDRDAVVMARDADDYHKLAAVSATDDMNRIQAGMADELSYASKTQDWQAGADLWTQRNVRAQDAQWQKLSQTRSALDDELRSGGRYGYDYGAAGKGLRELNDRYAELWERSDGAERNTVMDHYKRALDKRVMQISGSRTLDEGVKNKLVDLVRPYVDDMRAGLTSRKAWGRNADLQRDTNRGWEQLLGHWKVIQRKLYEDTGVTHYADTSSTRRELQATTERMYGAMTKNPVLAREFLEHYEGALDGVEAMADARRAWTLGPTQKFDELHDTLHSLAKNWNLAQVVGAAQQRVEHLKKSPATFRALAMQVGLSRLPFGIGTAAQALGKYLEHTNLSKGTPLADLVDASLKRYGKHPILSDARVAADFAPWVRDALRDAGAPLPRTPLPPPPVAASAASGAAAPVGPGLGEQAGELLKEHGSKVAGAGLFGLAASQKKDEDQGSLASAGLLAFMAPRLGSRLARKELEEAASTTLSRLYPHERSIVEHALEASADKTVGHLRGMLDGSRPDYSPEQLLDRQRSEVRQVIFDRHGQLQDQRRSVVDDAIDAQLKHRNLLTVEHDPELRAHALGEAPPVVPDAPAPERGELPHELAARLEPFERDRLTELARDDIKLRSSLTPDDKSALDEAFDKGGDHLWNVFEGYTRARPNAGVGMRPLAPQEVAEQQMRIVRSRVAAAQGVRRVNTQPFDGPLEQAARARLDAQNAAFAHHIAAAATEPVTSARRAELEGFVREQLGHQKLNLWDRGEGSVQTALENMTSTRNIPQMTPADRRVVGEIYHDIVPPRPAGMSDERAREIHSAVTAQMRGWRQVEGKELDAAGTARDVAKAVGGMSPEETAYATRRLELVEGAANARGRQEAASEEQLAGMRQRSAQARENARQDRRNRGEGGPEWDHVYDENHERSPHYDDDGKKIEDGEDGYSHYDSDGQKLEDDEDGHSHYYENAEELGLPSNVGSLGGGIELNVQHDNAVRRVFGEPLTSRDIHDMFGLDELDDLSGTLTLEKGSVSFRGETRDGVQLQRTYEKSRDGFIVNHDYFRTPKGHQGKGLGKNVIRGMFDFYERRGVDRVDVSAIEIGRYFWPHLGFQPSESATRAAFGAFRKELGDTASTLSGDWGLGLHPDQITRLLDGASTLRDLSDLVVPLSEIAPEHRETVQSWDNFERFFRQNASGPSGEEGVKVGKKFLLSKSGPWNSNLSVDVTPGSAWYDEFKARLAGFAALGFSLEEVMRAMSPMAAHVEPDRAAHEQDQKTRRSLSLFDAPGRPVQQEPVTASLVHARALKDVDQGARALYQTRARQLLGVRKAPSSRGSLATLTGRSPDAAAALERVRGQLDELSGDPQKLMARIESQMGDLPRTHPTVYTAMAQQLGSVVAYLQREIPKPKGRSLLLPKGTPPDSGDVLAFAAKYSGATDPEGAIRDMARGQALPQQVQALRDNWQDQYQQFRLNVLGELSALGTKSANVPLETMARLDDYLQLDGASNHAYSWAVSDAIDQARTAAAQTPKPQGGGGGKGQQASTAFQTRAQSAATERSMA